MDAKTEIADVVHGILTDKMTMLTAGAAVGVWATWEMYLTKVNSIAAANLPLATFAMICTTIFVRLVGYLWPRQPSRAVESKDAARSAWEGTKRFGWILGIVVAGVAALAFWKARDAKAPTLPAQQFVSAPTGRKRKPSDDDAGDEGDAEEGSSASSYVPPWLAKAKEMIGTDEDLGGRSNPVVREMFTAVDIERGKPWPLSKDGRPAVNTRQIPWCAVFVNWCLASVGVSGTRDAMARSFSRSRAFERLDTPLPGCIVVMWRGSYNDGESGHVGFYAGSAGGRYINILGGNQSDTVKLAKFHDSRVIGYFWPRGKLKSRTGQGVAGALAGGTAGGAALAYDKLVPDDTKIPGVPDGVSLEAARDTAEKIQQGLEMTGHPRAMRWAAMIGFGLLALGIASAAYALWRHSKDHSEGKL